MKLSQQITGYLESKQADNAVMALLTSCDSVSLQIVERIIIELSPSLNSLREIFELGFEVSKLQDRGLSQVLTELPLNEVFLEKKSRKEKLKILTKVLKNLRYPQRMNLLKAIESERKELVKACNFNVELPAELEGRGVTFSFEASSPEEVKAWAKRLEELSGNSHCKNLFDLLLGKDNER